MGSVARWILGGLAAVALLAAAASVVVSQPLFDETLDPSRLEHILIADPDQALTFARTREGEDWRLLLVSAYRQGQVSGADLGTAQGDPVRLFREQGYDGIRALAQAAPAITVPADALGVPFEAHERNIGVGLNYRAHAAESGLDEPPFLFPKYGLPTRFDSALARGDALLLDYEAELGLVLLDDLAAPAGARLGFVLANEVTDRGRLVRHFRRGAPMGTTGFSDGKSRAGFAPLGPLLLIPRDAEAFYRHVGLELYLNGRLRQRQSAAAMHWTPQRIVDEVFREARTAYRYRGQPVSLFGAGPPLPASTIIFSGTPAGVIFKPLNLWNPWVYLLPGDEVIVRADYLGTIRNRVTE